MEGVAHPDVRSIASKSGDRILLCSDRLTGMITDRHIGDILRMQDTPDDACQELSQRRTLPTGRDNVSAIVIDIGDRSVAPVTHAT